VVPKYEREGKSYLTIAFGCTGGMHRSVVLAEHVAAALGATLAPHSESSSTSIAVVHRDIQRDAGNASLTSLPVPSSPPGSSHRSPP
jgi:UPF0042 nucleotide-binding protein